MKKEIEMFSVWLHRKNRRPKDLYRGFDRTLANHYYTQAQAYITGKFSTTILKNGKVYCTWSTK